MQYMLYVNNLSKTQFTAIYSILIFNQNMFATYITSKLTKCYTDNVDCFQSKCCSVSNSIPQYKALLILAELKDPHGANFQLFML